MRRIGILVVAILTTVIVIAARAQQSPQAQQSQQLSQAPQAPPPPTYIPQTQFENGQDVVPVYEGWIRNPDGSFDFVFGYMNRNFSEELAIPVGPNNSVEPGGPDRGQPTYFLARRQARLFRVRVPKDWGQKVLIWSITANGRTEKVYADLRPVEEINEQIMQSGGNSLPFEPGNENPNRAPSISIAPVTSGSVSSPVNLIATVTDDGLPKPRVPAAPRPATATSSQGQANAGGQVNAGGAQVNAGGQANGAAGGAARGRGGMTVRWLQYGGPAKVTFMPAGAAPVTNGTSRATATFTKPGAYKLMATASDGQLSSKADVTVTVR